MLILKYHTIVALSILIKHYFPKSYIIQPYILRVVWQTTIHLDFISEFLVENQKNYMDRILLLLPLTNEHFRQSILLHNCYNHQMAD